MGNSLELIRKTVKKHMARTPQDAGWTLTLAITRYDNGLTNVAGIPISGDCDDITTARLVVQLLEEFCDEQQRRQEAA
jgi:hypothetical protein